jgi:putative membrane protein
MVRLPVVVAVVCAAAVALAADITPQSFVSQAASSGMAEVQLGKLAVKKSQNPQVKQFAQMMIKDHTNADNQLKSLAKKQNVSLPTAPGPEEQAAAKALQDKSGGAFDSAYAQQMVQDHQKAVDLFQQASQDNSLDPSLRTFAQKTLPKLQHHLEQAKKLNDAMAQAR